MARALNAKSVLERHQCTFYVGEVLLKLAATVRLSHWLAGEGDARVAATIKKLPRATLGIWQALTRDADGAVDPRWRLAEAPLERGGAALIDAMVADELFGAEAGKAARRAGALGVFDAFVSYRNAVIGHGGLRAPTFYARWTDLIAAALGELVASRRVLGDRELVVIAAGEEGDARAHVLRGTSALPWDGPIAPPGLYFGDATALVPVAPLVAYTPDAEALRDQVTFLHDVRVRGAEVRAAEYLDYVTGDVVELAATRAPLAALFARGTGELVERQVVDEAKPPNLAPGGAIGDFELGEVLGAGGQGTVFRAVQKSLGRTVALKVLRPELTADEAARKRFDREVRALVRSDHPQVVKVFVVGEDRGVRFYAMELIDGLDLTRPDALTPLRDPVPRQVGGALSRSEGAADRYWPRFAELFAGAADAIQHLHDRGIVHRDLKPGNLIVTADGDRLVVTDLGLAHLGDGSALTRDRSMLGTLRAMAPEQLAATPAATAPAVDVFGLGVALFEAATGRPMRDGANDAVVAAKIMQRPPRADAVAREVPAGLADVIAHALELEPSARTPTAAALAVELRALARGDRMYARRPRGRRFVVGGVAVAVVALAGVGIAMRHGSSPSPSPSPHPEVPTAAVADAGSPDAGRPPIGGMATIAAGSFTMGSTPTEIAAADAACRKTAKPDYCDLQRTAQQREAPVREVALSRFAIDTREVSAATAVAWLAREGARHHADGGLYGSDGALLAVVDQPHGLAWDATRGVSAPDPHAPVVLISWEGARRLCASLGKRLPTEAEWERAARGTGHRAYPWGDDPELRCAAVVYAIDAPMSAKCPGPGPAAVDRGDPGRDVTDEGVGDLAGNVSEWVADAVDTDAGYPACPAPCVDPVVAAGTDRVVRGGAYTSFADALRAASRARRKTTIAYDDVGVRCAKSLP